MLHSSSRLGEQGLLIPIFLSYHLHPIAELKFIFLNKKDLISPSRNMQTL